MVRLLPQTPGTPLSPASVGTSFWRFPAVTIFNSEVPRAHRSVKECMLDVLHNPASPWCHCCRRTCIWKNRKTDIANRPKNVGNLLGGQTETSKSNLTICLPSNQRHVLYRRPEEEENPGLSLKNILAGADPKNAVFAQFWGYTFATITKIRILTPRPGKHQRCQTGTNNT